MVGCPSCGRELAGEFAFCPFCGAVLGARPAAPARAERKTVTCLFCDLVGFTARAEQLDPEDVRAVLAPYHARVRGELERHGGTVEKFIGDAVMAVFGAPVAHEDDPERAVRAALAIRDGAAEERVDLRIGIATGEALVSLGARTDEGEGLAAGDVVNVAARLQAAAPVNGILVGEATYRATRRVIDYRAAEPIAAKGKAEPVPVWETLEARARLGAEVLDYVAGRLVGRERELALLHSALERVREERSPQLLTVVGVPGMGKSRLVYELARIADSDPELITWRQGRCLAYGDGVTFAALAEIVKAQAGILDGDGDEEAERKLRVAVAETLPGREDAAWVEARLRPLAGLGEQSEQARDRRDESFTAWRRFLEGMAEERPLVLVFEDLQWADEGLLDFVDELVDWASDVPLLVVCTARPELLTRRPGWGGGKLNATTVALSPLADRDTARLIADVLDRSLLPAETQQTLLERAGGNPLYAEQFALLYAERGQADDLPLPENLQGIVAARIDALPAAEKELLQDAAVVGKLFWTGCLRRSGSEAQPLLHALARKGFVRPQRRSSVAGEDEHAFAHVLVRDVAYGQIPRAERSQRHRQVAEWIESLGRPDDHAELAAYHWRSALELARAAGAPLEDLADRVRLALRQAGDRALALDAYAHAESYYADALSLWPVDDRERPDLLFRRARALSLAGDERRESELVAARDALAAAGDRARAAEASALLARAAWYGGDQERSDEHLTAAEQLVDGEPASAAKARVLSLSARQRTLAGELERGTELAREAVALAEQLGLEELRAHALATIGTAEIGTEGGGTAHLEQALAIARAANSPEAAGILVNLAVDAFFRGNVRREDELLEEAQSTAERFGNRDMARFSRADRIWTHWALGRWDEAAEEADRFLEECESEPHYLEGYARDVRASIRAARGNSDGALHDWARAVERARQSRDPQAVVPTLGNAAHGHAMLGRLDEARALAAETVAAASAHPAAMPALGSLGLLAKELGVAQEVRVLLEAAARYRSLWHEAALASVSGDLARAADLYLDGEAVSLEAEARLLAGEQLIAAGRRAEGEAQLGRALAFHRTVGAVAYIARGEALLAASA